MHFCLLDISTYTRKSIGVNNKICPNMSFNSHKTSLKTVFFQLRDIVKVVCVFVTSRLDNGVFWYQDVQIILKNLQLIQNDKHYKQEFIFVRY